MAEDRSGSCGNPRQHQYRAPTLTVFGAAIHLTASGTSQTGEGKGGGNSKKP